MSPGFLSLAGFTPTPEGIDRKMAVHFYGRWKFVTELLPLLEAAEKAGEDARVVSVLHAGRGCVIDLDDLGLKKHYTISKSARASPSYNSLAVEVRCILFKLLCTLISSSIQEFSKRYPNISFSHIYPGIIDTPIFSELSPLLAFLTRPLLYPFLTSAEVRLSKRRSNHNSSYLSL